MGELRERERERKGIPSLYETTSCAQCCKSHVINQRKNRVVVQNEKCVLPMSYME